MACGLSHGGNIALAGGNITKVTLRKVASIARSIEAARSRSLIADIECSDSGWAVNNRISLFRVSAAL
jgi:hypothetical protein